MSTPRRKKVSDAIRILQRKRDASARATHLMVGKDPLITYEKALTDQAEGGIVPNSTLFERKIMSTNTSIKRIALVAAAALTLGGFSVITAGSANAAASAATGLGFYAANAAPTGATIAALTNPGTVASPVAVSVVANTTPIVAINNTDSTTADTFTVYSDSAFTTLTTSGLIGNNTAITGRAANAGYAGGDSGTVSVGSVSGTYYVKFSTGNVTAAYAAVTVSDMLATTYDGTISGLGSTSINGVAGAANTVTLTAVRHTAGGKAGFITVSGAGATIASIGGNASATGATTGTIPAVTSETTQAVVINTPNAGTVTVTYSPESAAGSGIAAAASSTVTITVNQTGSSGVLSTANSTLYDTTTVGSSANSAASAPTGVATASSNPVARYTFTLKDALSAAYNLSSTKTLVASVTGPGLIATASTNSGTAAKSASFSTATNTGDFYLYGDGTSGVTTVTFTQGSTVIATKSFTFYSTTVKALTATVNHSIVLKGSAPAGFAFDSGTAGVVNYISVVAADASGNPIPSLTNLSASSSSTSIATVGTPTWDATDLVYYVPVTGVASGSVTITVKDSTGLISATGSLSVAKAVITTWSAAFGSSTYNAGDAATLVITAKDADGNAVADGYYNNALGGAFSTSQALTSTLFGTALKFVGGVATAKFYAPYNSGTLTANATGGSSTTLLSTAIQALAGVTALTATTSVTAANGSDASLALDAANAATDAANNAYDEAQNATQAASDALAAVKALAVQVKALIALVTKIKNKVGA